MDKIKLYRQLVETNKAKLDEGWKDWIDKIQSVGDVVSSAAGFIPVVGQGIAAAIDATSAVVDVAQDDKADAAMRGVSAVANVIPGAGAAVKAGRIAGKLAGAAKTVGNVAKVADKVGDAAKFVGNIDRFAGTANTVGNIAGNVGDIARKTGGIIDKVRGSSAVGIADKALNRYSTFRKSIRGTAQKQEKSDSDPGESTSSKPVSRNFLPPNNDAFDISRKQALAASYNPSYSSLLYEKIIPPPSPPPPKPKPRIKGSGKGEESKNVNLLSPEGIRVDTDLQKLPTWTGKVSQGTYGKSIQTNRQSRRELPWESNPMTYAPEVDYWRYGNVADSFDPLLSESQQLKSLVSSKVSEYLKSKEGQKLKSHLNNLRLDMKNK